MDRTRDRRIRHFGGCRGASSSIALQLRPLLPATALLPALCAALLPALRAALLPGICRARRAICGARRTICGAPLRGICRTLRAALLSAIRRSTLRSALLSGIRRAALLSTLRAALLPVVCTVLRSATCTAL